MDEDADWLVEFAEEAGFIFNGDDLEFSNKDSLIDLLEHFANIVANAAISQFVTKMTADIRGDEALH